MFRLFKNCIFCGIDLPESGQETGVGEHVFPKNVYGCWRIYDVCAACMRIFGNEVDIAASQDPDILNAMVHLKPSDVKKFLNHVPYIASDPVDLSPVKMVRRGNDFHIKVTDAGPLHECSELHWDRLGKPWVRRELASEATTDEIESVISELEAKYPKLNPGEAHIIERYRIGIRKKQAANPKIDRANISQITRLVAKIAVCYCYYAIPLKVTERIPVIDTLVRHAITGEELPPFLVNPCRLFTEPKPPANYHAMKLDISQYGMGMDITFFGLVNWRISLKVEGAFKICGRDERLLKSSTFILDFSERPSKKISMLSYTDGETETRAFIL